LRRLKQTPESLAVETFAEFAASRPEVLESTEKEQRYLYRFYQLQQHGNLEACKEERLTIVKLDTAEKRKKKELREEKKAQQDKVQKIKDTSDRMAKRTADANEKELEKANKMAAKERHTNEVFVVKLMTVEGQAQGALQARRREREERREKNKTEEQLSFEAWKEKDASLNLSQSSAMAWKNKQLRDQIKAKQRQLALMGALRNEHMKELGMVRESKAKRFDDKLVEQSKQQLADQDHKKLVDGRAKGLIRNAQMESNDRQLRSTTKMLRAIYQVRYSTGPILESLDKSKLLGLRKSKTAPVSSPSPPKDNKLRPIARTTSPREKKLIEAPLSITDATAKEEESTFLTAVDENAGEDAAEAAATERAAKEEAALAAAAAEAEAVAAAEEATPEAAEETDAAIVEEEAQKIA
jgi:hypothetical protein